MPTMLLDVPMTDAETIETGDKMVDVLARLSAVKAEKKDVVAAFGKRIRALETELEELARQQREKAKKADVEVETVYSSENREMTVVRKDTGAVVHRRPATDEERQPSLNLVPEDATAEVARTEEQLNAGSPEEAEEMRAARLAERSAKVIDMDGPRTLLRAPKSAKDDDAEDAWT